MAQSTEINMPYRFLGNTGLLVSALSFGSWVTFDTQTDFDASYKLMIQAKNAGINFFDNAEYYGLGKAEELMGKAISQGIKDGHWEREDLVISTKIFFGDGKEGPNRKGLSRKHLIEGTKNSLKRLQLDYVDLIFCHRPDPLVPLEETIRAMNYLIEKGYALYWGTSEWTADQIIRANEISERLCLIPPQFDQPQYNIIERSKVEYYYKPLYERYKYGLTIWSPLASGILTGKYSGGKIPEGARLGLKGYEWLKEAVIKNAPKADKLKKVADKLGCSLAQLAVAWCLANKNVSTVILGATKPHQLAENIEAIKYVPKITAEIKKEIDEFLPFVLQPETDPFPELIQVHNQYIEA